MLGPRMLPAHFKHWRLTGSTSDYVVAPSRDLPDDARAQAVPGLVATALIAPWLADPWSRRAVLAMYRETGGLHPVSERVADLADLYAHVTEHLDDAFRRGDLVALRREQVEEAFEGESSDTAPKDDKGKSDDKTWIAIKVVDEDGNPVPRRKYKVVTSTYETREGVLDEKGEARVQGIDPGDCEITFPGIHEDDWAA